MTNLTHLTRVVVRKNPNYKHNGLKSYAYLLNKYNIAPTVDGPFSMVIKNELQVLQAALKPHDEKTEGQAHAQRRALVKSNAATGNSSRLSAQDVQHDSLYLAPVSIGNPPQQLNLNFDTGSADLWVWSEELSSSTRHRGQQTGHAIYAASKSRSATAPQHGQRWQIQYGDGSSASGDVVYDTLLVGGLTIKNQAVERAVHLSQEFVQSAGDGLLGLAFGTINTVTPNRVQTPVESMITQQDIPQTAELFTAYLGSWKDANNPDKGQSFYTFGYIDRDVVSASGQAICYVPVDNSQGFWQFPSNSAVINGRIINRSGNTAIADTGTTLALVDDSLCKAIYAAIPGSRFDNTQQGYLIPTNISQNALPAVQFAVGDQTFKVLKEDLLFQDLSNGMTYGGIQSRGSLNFDILGDTFLKSIYAIFDQGNKRFGCVQRVEPSSQ